MLSRTALNLFWIARYMERAEMTARLLDVGARNALLPNTGQGFRNEWQAILDTCGSAAGFKEKYGDPVQHNVETYLFFDKSNPSSIASCIATARENARIARASLTTQIWDTMNVAFQEMVEMQRTERSKLELSELTDWTRRTAALVRGSIESTLLRNDGYHFLNLGYALERADNTARILDVKYYVLLPEASYVGTRLDTYQWTTLLRALSAQRAFHHIYRGSISARQMVDFVILNRQFPRGLLTSVEAASGHLDHLARGYGRAGVAHSRARALFSELAEARVEDVFEEGLHEFLIRFIAANDRVAQAVNQTYFRGEM